jgi:putative ABC transport system permease protein
VPPLAALREVAVERVRSGRVRGVIATVLGVAGVLLVVTATQGDATSALPRAGIGAFATLVAMIMAGPVVARRAAAVVGAPIAAARGRTGALARQNAMRSPRRTAATASALMVGVGVVTLFIVFGASIKASVDSSVRGAFRGDLVIASQDFSGAGMSPDLATELRHVPDVAQVTAIGSAPVRIAGKDRTVTVTDPSTVEPMLDLDVAQGSFDRLGSDGLAASRKEADTRGWKLGDTVEVTFADGTTDPFQVRAVYGVQDLMGEVILPEAAWAPHASQRSLDAVLVDARQGADISKVRTSVQEVAERFDAPDVQDRDQYVGDIAGQVDQMLGLVYALLALSIVIALMGIGNTLSLAIHERTRELGLLRAVGQTRGQTRSMVRWESVIVAVFGTAGGVALGSFLGWGVVRALSVQEGFGTLSLPVGQLVTVVAVGALAGVLAGIRPARRAARLDVLDALAA